MVASPYGRLSEAGASPQGQQAHHDERRRVGLGNHRETKGHAVDRESPVIELP